MESKLKAALFDVDGLILDSEAFYARVWTEVFNMYTPIKHRVEEKTMIEWFYNNLSGKKIGKQLAFIQNAYKHSDIPHIYEEYRKEFRSRQQTSPIDVRSGFFELIDFLKSNDIKLGLVSTSSKDTISTVLNNANVDMAMFSVVVTGDMGLEFKPSPEPYLKACELLNIKPYEAVVFEDSESGVMSAYNGGLDCMLVPSQAPISDYAKSSASRVLNTLDEAIDIIKTDYLDSEPIQSHQNNTQSK